MQFLVETHMNFTQTHPFHSFNLLSSLCMLNSNLTSMSLVAYCKYWFALLLFKNLSAQQERNLRHYSVCTKSKYFNYFLCLLSAKKLFNCIFSLKFNANYFIFQLYLLHFIHYDFIAVT